MNNRNNRKKERGEVFVEVEGFGNRYEISNRGRLWSNVSNRYIGYKNKKTGYIHATLTTEEGDYVHLYIHRLVGEAFIPNDDPENKTEINHRNHKRHDNRVENLEWVSHQENMEYSYDNVFTEENRTKFSNNIKRLNQNPEFQKRQKEGIKKKWEDPEFREKIRAAAIEVHNKPVEQYNIDGELVGTYPSATAAQEATGIDRSSICNVLKGRFKTAGGYKWKYKEE